MEGSVEDGGLNMVNVTHLQNEFYIQWVRKLAASGEEKWTHVPRWLFSKLTNSFGVFNFNYHSKYVEVKGLDKIESGFGKTVVCTFPDAGKLTNEKRN